MPGCVFHVSGESFDVDAYLASGSHWKPYQAYRQGELRGRSKKGTVNRESGFKVMVSENDELEKQIQDALGFINLHAAELNRLRDLHGQKVELGLSFSKIYQEPTFPYARFPRTLVREAAKFDLSLEIGMFPASQGS